MSKRWAVVISVLAIVSVIIVSVAYAKPRSTIDGALKAWAKRGKVVEMKREHKTNILTTVLLKDDQIIMYESAGGKTKTLKPTREYNIEKIKVLKAYAPFIHKRFMEDPQFQDVPPVVRAIGIGTLKNGKIEYRVHVYSSTGPYRGYWAFDFETNKFARTIVGAKNTTDPAKEKWGVAEGEEEADEDGAAEEEGGEAAEEESGGDE